MQQHCQNCSQYYDDTYRLTLCEHILKPTSASPPKIQLAVALIDKPLRFLNAVSEEGKRVAYRIQRIDREGMIEVSGFSGMFSPMLFALMEETPPKKKKRKNNDPQ